MVVGLEKFKEYFKEHQDCYLVIGGTACDIILDNEGFTPRATDDIDIILIVEAFTPAFVKQFWDFIRAGEYTIKEKEKEKRNCYRFANPKNAMFPKQIELFSRVPDAIGIDETIHLTPIPVDEGLSSLSAILLDEDYYQFTRKNSEKKDGVHFALPHALICLKAFAYLNNRERKEAGEPISKRDILKHRNDVFRLTILLKPEDNFETPERIKNDLQQFANAMKSDLPDANILKENGFGRQNMENVFSQFLKSFNLIA
jgi:hypothetical protein